jgi:hypothetical protein
MRAPSITFKITAKEVKGMAKYLNLWRMNPMAPSPTDPADVVKLYEMHFAAVDNWLKTGDVKEFGFFLDGRSGYVIAEGDSKGIFRRTFSFYPFIESEVQEMVPYETGEEIIRGL